MRRATVMLLGAWYALIPPVVGGQVAPHARLAEWEQMRAFDSADECEKMALDYARRLSDQNAPAFRQVQYMRCVNVADPRLQDAR